MLKKIKIVFSSHLSDEDNEKFIDHIHNTIGLSKKDYEVVCYKNFNEYSLTEIYNKDLNQDEYDHIILYCHNDIFFKTNKWGKTLLNKFNHSFNGKKYDIIGVAGIEALSESGMWWDRQYYPERAYGIVEHINQMGAPQESRYSNEFIGVKTVVLVDGLFIACNPNTITQKFDESVKGFHFYDIDFCINNYLDGCNVGVITDIRLLHYSVGRPNQQWEDNRKQFVEKYKDYLPLEIEP